MEVESIYRVLREQGVQVAARTYRHWKKEVPALRTVTDAQILNALYELRGTPESLYGRRKMVAHLRRQGHAVAHCTVDRLMRLTGMNVYLQTPDHGPDHHPGGRGPRP